MLTRRLIQWYSGMEDYELLLDQADVDYMLYGTNTNNIGLATLSSANATLIEELGYNELYNKLLLALEKPCFPQLMKDYSSNTGKTIAALLPEVESHVRSWSRRHEYYYSHSHSNNNSTDNNSTDNFYGIPSGGKEELELLLSFQKSITILQVRQSDAYLRLIRQQLLIATNTCENLIKKWKLIVADQSQTLRKPLLGYILTHFAGITNSIRANTLRGIRATGQPFRYNSTDSTTSCNSKVVYSSEPITASTTENVAMDEEMNNSISKVLQLSGGDHVNTILKDLNSREKLILLENIQLSFYEAAGTIQSQLDQLQIVSRNLQQSFDYLDTYNGVSINQNFFSSSNGLGIGNHNYSERSNSYSNSNGNSNSCNSNSNNPKDLESEAWNDMNKWINEAVILSRRTLLLLSFQSQSGFHLTNIVVPANDNSYNENEKFTDYQNVDNKTPGKRKKNTDALETYSVYDDIEGTSTTPNSYTMEENKYEEQINLENLILSSFSDAPASTTTGNRSLKLHDFVLNSPIDTVIDRCVIRQSLWFSVLEATGRDMLTVSGWNSINSYINQSIIENLTISSNHSNYVDVDLLKYIWYRQSTYSQEYRGSFSSPTTAVHTLHELINTAQLWNIANTSNNTITKLPTGSVIIIHQIDLSNFTQFNNCSYTLRWVLEPIHQLDSDITIHNLKNQTNNSLPLGKATKIKVTVDLQVPTTSVIVKDLRQLIVLWHNSAEKLLQDKNYHQIWADRQRELSQSEVLILNSMNNSITEATTVINTPKEADHTVLGAIRSLFGFDTNSYKDTVTIVKSDVSNINDNSSVNSNSIISESGNSQDSSIDSVDNKDSYSNSYANQSNIESTFTVSHDSVNHADSHTLLVESSLLNELENNFQQLRNQWRSSALIVKDISIIPSKFKETLVLLGLKKKGRRGIFKYVRVRVFIRFCFWFGLMRGLFEGAKRSDDIAWGAETVLKNMRDFVDRRLATPTRTTGNSKLLLLLQDLSTVVTMNRPKLSASERRRLVRNMDMSCISEEYEVEIKRPIRNIVSGRIARLVLIQMQFLKKELLVAMQAIDELFAANQVNLQLLAVTPAIMSIFAVQVVAKTLIIAIKATSRGRALESRAEIFRDIRRNLREIERTLNLSEENEQKYMFIVAPKDSNSDSNSQNSNQSMGYYSAQNVDMVISNSAIERGKLMSQLFRIQMILSAQSGTFEVDKLQLFQEDLRELAIPSLTKKQKLRIIQRMYRSYPFLQPVRGLFG